MNILLINNIINKGSHFTVGGVEYHRVVKPFTVLRRIYPEYDFLMADVLTDQLDEVLEQTEIVIFSRCIGWLDQVLVVSNRLKNKGKIIGLDLDDYWHLPENHVSFNDYQKTRYPEAVELSIKQADFVTCTTPHLADKIRQINPSVHIIENGIDPNDPEGRWTPSKTKSERIRFGFTGGNTHYHDIELIAPSVQQALKDSEFQKRGQIVLSGFSAIKPLYEGKTIEQKYEEILTGKLRTIRQFHHEYMRDLKLARDLRNPGLGLDKPYRRIWSKDVLEYSSIYDDIDVCVAPLADNEFNSCKSELKLLEAGFKDCAVMCHHVKPYTLLATDKNSFDLNKKSFYDWAKYLLNNPNALEDSKAQLRDDVEKYDLKHLTEKRHNLYKQFKKQTA